MARVLITGGAGFIGSHTADLLIRAGHEVRALDILDPQVHAGRSDFPDYLHPDVERVRGDVRNAADIRAALGGVEVVYHFAALTGVGQSMYALRDYADTNCTGTATLLEVLAGLGRPIRRLVLASSRAVYGEGAHQCPAHGRVRPAERRREDLERGEFDLFCPECGERLSSLPTQESQAPTPISMYAWTKLQQEELCRFAARTFRLPVTILRYFNVYGSRQSLKNPYTGVVSIFYSRMMAGQPISLYESGLPGRDFVHVTDVAQANVRAMEAEVEPGTAINVGTGCEHTIIDVARALADACGRAPNWRVTGEFRVGDIRSCYADISRARKLLGYEPRMGLEAGMAEFSAWAGGQESADLYARMLAELESAGLFGRGRKGNEAWSRQPSAAGASCS